MRRQAAVVALVISCGGGESRRGTGDPSAFAGVWAGELSITIAGRTSAQALSLFIDRAGDDGLRIEGLCADAGGPGANMIDATHFAVQNAVCAPAWLAICSNVSMTFTGGQGVIAGENLEMSLDAQVSGCGAAFAAAYRFSGAYRGPGPFLPEAVIGVRPSGGIPLHTPVVLDAALSTNSRAGDLAYHWELAVPSGSSAQLTSPAGNQVNGFIPDVLGIYRVTLTVSNDVLASVPQTVKIVAGVAGVFAVASVPPEAVTGDDVLLDATESVDAQGRPISFSWSIASAPAGSTARISNASAAQAHFAPDLAGIYVVSLNATAGDSGSIAERSIDVASNFPTLAFQPLDVKYSRDLDRVVAIARSPDSLHIVDPGTRQDLSVPLSGPPLSFDLSADGKSAVVAHDHAVTYVDLAGARVVASWPTSVNPSDVVLSLPTFVVDRLTFFAYLFAATRADPATSSPLYMIDLGNGQETNTSPRAVGEGLHGVRAPNEGKVYSILDGVLESYQYTGEPTAQSLFFLGPWSVAPVGDRLWFSGDGLQLFTDSRERFHVPEMDRDVQSLPSAVPGNRLWTADWSLQAQRWVLQPAPDSSGNAVDTTFWTVDSGTLGGAQKFAYPVFAAGGKRYPLHGRYVFFKASGNQRVAVCVIDGAAGLQLNHVVLVL